MTFRTASLNRVAGNRVDAAACAMLVLWLSAPLAAGDALTAETTRAADPPAPGVVDAIAQWRAGVRERILEQLIVPPDTAPDARAELEVSLLASGNAADVSTRRSSGFPAFDAAARRAVLAATPLPMPADVAAYERVRRFGVIFEPRVGVQVVDAQAPVAPHAVPGAPAAAAGAPGAVGTPGAVGAPGAVGTPGAAGAPAAASPPERFVCSTAGLGPATAPDCSHTGSRSALLNCFAQAVQRRAVKLVSACAASAYPLEARRNRWEGTVQVGVGFDHGGKPAGLSIAQSSGQPLLDQRALEIVQAALVPPPAELYATPFAVRVPMVFRMHRPEAK